MDDQLNQDPLLEALVALADRGTMEIGVTLTVGGVLVSGVVAGLRRYQRAVEEYLMAAPSQTPEAREVFVNALRNDRIDQEARELGELGDPKEIGETPHYQLILLVDTYIHHAPGSSTFVGPWRGRLSAVDGWSYGHIRQGN